MSEYTQPATDYLAKVWLEKADASRKEAARILKTIKEPTSAEGPCYTRAEIWEQCAAELQAVQKDLLAHLAAAEEMCRDLQQSVDGMAYERLALESENARLREALRRCVDAVHLGYGVNTCGCLACKAARRLLEAKP